MLVSVSSNNNFNSAEIILPGSKYIGNRALVLAALAKGESKLFNLPANKDIAISINGLRQLGADIRQTSRVTYIRGIAGRIKSSNNEIYTGASGTFSRFILSLACLSSKKIKIHGNAQMNKRPMLPLIQALEDLGCHLSHNQGCLPIITQGPIIGHRKVATKNGDAAKISNQIQMDGSISSQFFSSLMLTAPYSQHPITIKVTGHQISLPYILMTAELMKKFSVQFDINDPRFIQIPNNKEYFGRDLTIEADPVSSTYFMALAALTGKKIKIKHFNSSGIQGETYFYQVLQKMGCQVAISRDSISVTGPKNQLKGIEVDMGGMPDASQTLAVMAAYAKGKTVIKNVAHLRHKESNRLEDTVEQLKKLSIKAHTSEDSMTIYGGTVQRGAVDSCDDHRMAMSFALASVMTPGVLIHGAECVAKSFPTYWDKLAEIGFKIEKK